MILVLYSRKDSVWKLGDFGFTSEANSRSFHPSAHARGTPCYRAPELLVDEPTYNNKVDIWSMGCVLYELATGIKAFNNDFATLEYRSGKSLDLGLDKSLSEQCREKIIKNVAVMLNIEPSSRPSATYLLQEFSRDFTFPQVQHDENRISSATNHIIPANTNFENVMPNVTAESQMRAQKRRRLN